MPKTISLPFPLDDDDIVTVKLWKRDLRNALYLESEPFQNKTEKILLSTLELPAVWTVECALLRRGYTDALLGDDDGDAQDAFARITKAGDECHAIARRIVRKEFRGLEYSGQCEPSSNFKLKRYNIRSFKKFALADGDGNICARAAVFGPQWRMFVERCIELWGPLSSEQKAFIDWCLTDISTAVRDALIRRDYGALMEKLHVNDLGNWQELRDAILAISKERDLS